MQPSSIEHVQFLNRYYSRVHRWYDVTRKFYLCGRDDLLRDIVARQPQHVIEIGCGTGRNLAMLKRQLPDTQFGGVEPCDSMRQHANARHPWIVLSDSLAEDADLPGLLSQAPDVIFLSYSLSMVQNKQQAINNCLQALAPHGRLYLLDFGGLQGLGKLGSATFHAWLHVFHVFPEHLDTFWKQAHEVKGGPLAYWKQATFLSRPIPS